MDKVTRQCPQTTTFLTAEAVSNRGPSAYQPNTLPLGQTGSLRMDLWLSLCTLYLHACQMRLSYRRRLRSLLLHSSYVFRALINSLVCWICRLDWWSGLTLRVRLKSSLESANMELIGTPGETHCPADQSAVTTKRWLSVTGGHRFPFK